MKTFFTLVIGFVVGVIALFILINFAIGTATIGHSATEIGYAPTQETIRYCTERYKSRRYAGLTDEGRERLITVCAIAEERRK